MQIPTGDEMRAARKAKGLSQSEIAQKTDLSQPLVSRVESGDVDPCLSTLHKLALAINQSEAKFDVDRLEVIIPDALKNRREQAGMTQSQLAEAAGVSQPLISRIEGESVDPRASTLRAVLGALKDTDEAIQSIGRDSNDGDRQDLVGTGGQASDSTSSGTIRTDRRENRPIDDDILAEIQSEFNSISEK